jgi:hypothetical protein
MKRGKARSLFATEHAKRAAHDFRGLQVASRPALVGRSGALQGGALVLSDSHEHTVVFLAHALASYGKRGYYATPK